MLHLSGYLLFRRRRAASSLAWRQGRGARGIPVSVDPASAGFLAVLGVPRFLDLVAGADLLLPNAAEAALLSGTGEPGAPVTGEPGAAAAALSRRGGTVVVTLGAGGALAAHGGRVTARAPASPAAAVVDTTGAGDAFTGGLLAARLTGADLPDALSAGCHAGAEAVALVGGRPSPP